jgi:anti-sigma factor RsiW
MNCKQFQEHVLDLAGADPGPGELQDHLRSCSACAAQVASLRQTMSLLEQWTAPADTSPYFMTRLRARLDEEQARPASWLNWFRKPALAISIMVLMVASISIFQGSWRVGESSGVRAAVSGPGTAIGDLQYLDKNHDLLADFELLDDLPAQN